MNYVCRHGRRIAIDTLSTAAPIKRRKPFVMRFVKLPDYWIEQLHKSNNPGAFKLAHCILKEDFKRQYVGGEIVLSTKTTRLCRKVRSKAVKELVGLGLIKIEQNGNQATRVISIIIEKEKERIEPCRVLEGTPRTSRGNAAYPWRTRGNGALSVRAPPTGRWSVLERAGSITSMKPIQLQPRHTDGVSSMTVEQPIDHRPPHHHPPNP